MKTPVWIAMSLPMSLLLCGCRPKPEAAESGIANGMRSDDTKEEVFPDQEGLWKTKNGKVLKFVVITGSVLKLEDHLIQLRTPAGERQVDLSFAIQTEPDLKDQLSKMKPGSYVVAMVVSFEGHETVDATMYAMQNLHAWSAFEDPPGRRPPFAKRGELYAAFVSVAPSPQKSR
jgi:hypothetical protein